MKATKSLKAQFLENVLDIVTRHFTPDHERAYREAEVELANELEYTRLDWENLLCIEDLRQWINEKPTNHLVSDDDVKTMLGIKPVKK